jgi:asparagine synthase (glutamine-hydrolysing)
VSAIFGILRFDGSDASERDLERMGNTLAHCSPDGRKFVIHDTVGLGHCLMRVNNEDMFEAQPLRDREAGLTLVADCRVDNREELAEAFGLSAADIRDMPDSAFILRAYKTWGEDCAEHLLGDFAFALWDARAKKLVLGRDHMGQRICHYHCGKDFFAFATEIRALWTLPDVPRNLNEAQIGRRLLRDPTRPAGVTFFENVYGLTAGTVMRIVADGQQSTKIYWQPRADQAHENQNEKYYVTAYRQILTEAVACRLRRLAWPAALSMSGGFDSTAIAGLAGPMVTAQGRKLIAVSSVLEEGYHGPLRNARPWVERAWRTMPHLDVRYFVRGQETALTDLEKWFVQTGLPPFEDHYVITGLAKLAAGAGARLMMDGHGGDYTINPRGGGALAWFLRKRHIARFLRELRPYMRMSGRTAWQTFKHDIVKNLLPVPVMRAWRFKQRGFVSLQTVRGVSPDFARDLIQRGLVDPKRLLGMPRNRADMRARMVEVLLRTYCQASHPPVDLIAAVHGMAFTRPFLDKRVVELGLAIPESLYVKDGQVRYLACRALADIYSSALTSRHRPNDPNDPDFSAMLRSIEEPIRREIERMAGNRKLSAMIDFTTLRGTMARPAHENQQDIDSKAVSPLRAVLVARFIEWARRDNR